MTFYDMQVYILAQLREAPDGLRPGELSGQFPRIEREPAFLAFEELERRGLAFCCGRVHGTDQAGRDHRRFFAAPWGARAKSQEVA